MAATEVAVQRGNLRHESTTLRVVSEWMAPRQVQAGDLPTAQLQADVMREIADMLAHLKVTHAPRGAKLVSAEWTPIGPIKGESPKGAQQRVRLEVLYSLPAPEIVLLGGHG